MKWHKSSAPDLIRGHFFYQNWRVKKGLNKGSGEQSKGGTVDSERYKRTKLLIAMSPKWKVAKDRILSLIEEHLESLTDGEVKELHRLQKLASHEAGESPEFLYEQALKVAETTRLYSIESATGRQTVRKDITLEAVVRFLRKRNDANYLVKRQNQIIATGTQFIRHRSEE